MNSLGLSGRQESAPCCGDQWFRNSMQILNNAIGQSQCGNVPDHWAWSIKDPFIHLLASSVQLFSRKLFLPRNTTWLLLKSVIWNGGLASRWCPLALHMAKLMQAEMLLLSALPVLSEDTPAHILQRIIRDSLRFEREGESSILPGGQFAYGPWGDELVAEGRKRLKRFRGYVRDPGKWQSPRWENDVDVQLALTWHVGLKECLISNFSVGDFTAERSLTMASSPSLWEQAMLAIQSSMDEVERRLQGRVKYALAGGTLLAMLRHGTGARTVDGVVDFVDKDIDVLVMAHSSADWWSTVSIIDETLRSSGWQGCSLTIRDSKTMERELELEKLQQEIGIPLVSRGVMELVCALFGADSVTFEPALVPFNAVWVKPFRFSHFFHGRRFYREVHSLEETSFLMSSSACSLDGACIALSHFPLQAWRGVLPVQVAFPTVPCLFLPASRLMKQIALPDEKLQRFGIIISLPCPRKSLQLLQWYDRGELWGRVPERPCLALPLVVHHDRVQNPETDLLMKKGLSNVAVHDFHLRMAMIESLGGVSLLDEMMNCSFSPDGTYSVSSSKFKGSTNAEADCGPWLSGGRPDWRSPSLCPSRIREYNHVLPNLRQEWSAKGYLKKRPMKRRSKGNQSTFRSHLFCSQWIPPINNTHWNSLLNSLNPSRMWQFKWGKFKRASTAGTCSSPMIKMKHNQLLICSPDEWQKILNAENTKRMVHHPSNR